MRKLRRSLILVPVEVAAVLLVYLAAAVMLTWPVAPNINDVVPGGGELGGWLWRYWWHFLEVEALGVSTMGPLERFSSFLSLGRYPETGNILDVLIISWPLSQILEFPAHYNVKVLIILTLNGLCGYTLGRHLVSGRLIALAAGLLAVVNPLVIQDINGSGLRQCILWWLLLYPVFLDRAARGHRLLDAVLAGLCLGASAAWFWFYGIFAGMYTILYVLARLVGSRSGSLGLVRWGGPLVLVAFISSLPFVRPYFNQAEGSGAALPELSFFVPFPRYETILEAPLRPDSYKDNVLASLNRTIRSSWAADYMFIPVNWRSMPVVVMLLGVIPLLARRRGTVWLLALLIFYVGTLGPFLKLSTMADADAVLRIKDQWVVRLPYTLFFQWVPGLSRLFAPYRMASMVVVASVAVLALGLSQLPAGSTRRRWFRNIVAILAMAATMAQVNYRFEVAYVSEDAFRPTRWRVPVKVSRMTVPEFYEQLAPDRMEGLIELPLNREQDVLAWYQVTHQQKVFGSWATMGSVPPFLLGADGGAGGERIRYLSRALPTNIPGGRELEQFSQAPSEVPPEALAPERLKSLVKAGSFRYLVVHERGYYLVDPFRGPLLYGEAVRRLTEALGIQPVQHLEHQWEDYPGNRYQVPDGPVYVPWSAEEINLPDPQMPSKLYMAVFDLSPILDTPV